MNHEKARQLALCGVIAALYVALGIVFAPISFGLVQMRVAEALTLLPVFTPAAIWGLTIGCVITNAYGLTVGANIIGAADILIGSAATLIAACMSWQLRRLRFRRLPVAAAIPPILVNALVVGAELALVTATEGAFWPTFFIQALLVGLGQFGSCMILGLALCRTLEKLGLDKKLFASRQQSV